MKRLVICFDGTWNTINKPREDTNVVRIAQAVKMVDSQNVAQVVYYNSGVGSGGPIDRFLGGVFGAGLKSNVKRGLTFLSFNWNSGETPDDAPDEIYIFGFSRGAYTARALAGVIHALGGIPEVSSFGEAEEMWAHYRKSKRGRKNIAAKIQCKIQTVPHGQKIIKCVAVWDTVGSYGIPAGLGLTGLARWITSWTRNFRDNELGSHIEYGFHAMAIDERRRAFSPTAWVPRKKKGDDEGGQSVVDPVVEQVWFAGAHANVGGGYEQTGLSDLALIWMMARVYEKTRLEFEESYIRDNFWPCSACSAYRSNKGWWFSSLWPYVRSIPKVAFGAGDTAARGAILDGRVHWSVKERLGRLSLVDQDRYHKYLPKNLSGGDAYTEHSATEDRFIQLCRDNADAHKQCALYRDLEEMDRGWLRGRWRARRMRRLRESWKDIIAAQVKSSDAGAAG
jgi:uncharacterized protein (DUF2235 family)